MVVVMVVGGGSRGHGGGGCGGGVVVGTTLLAPTFDGTAAAGGDGQDSQREAYGQRVVAMNRFARGIITEPPGNLLHPVLRSITFDDDDSSTRDFSKFAVAEEIWLFEQVQLRKLWRFFGREGATAQWAILAEDFNKLFRTGKDGKALKTHFTSQLAKWKTTYKPGGNGGSGTQPEQRLHIKDGQPMEKEEKPLLHKVAETCRLWVAHMEGRAAEKEKDEERRLKKEAVKAEQRQATLETLVKAGRVNEAMPMRGDVDSWTYHDRRPPRPGNSSSTTGGVGAPKPHSNRSSCGQAREKLDQLAGVLKQMVQGKEELLLEAKSIRSLLERQTLHSAMNSAVVLDQMKTILAESEARTAQLLRRELKEGGEEGCVHEKDD